MDIDTSVIKLKIATGGELMVIGNPFSIIDEEDYLMLEKFSKVSQVSQGDKLQCLCRSYI